MNTKLQQIDHIVVLMLENRSFDNMLGWLHDPHNPPPFDHFPPGPYAGVNHQPPLSNPIPSYAADYKRRVVPVGRGHVMTNPNPDPGEEYYHVNTQLFNAVIPKSNRFASEPPPLERSNVVVDLLDRLVRWLMGLFGHDRNGVFKPPFNLPEHGRQTPSMNGFVTDYVNDYQVLRGKPPTYDEYRVIMDCFPPEAVPVISQLANSYAVCDHWHCSVPSQTFCNRAFVHAATSSGWVVNAPYVNWLFTDAETIFNRIENDPRAELTWKVYYDEMDLASLTWLIQPRLWKYRTTNFSTMDQFHHDARHGTLPSYSFIEPRLLLDHNDEHPPIDDPLVTSSVLAGELLINDVYQAVRNGKHWDRTMLIVTYDEHGGCYDHVPPPPAVPPEKGGPPGQYGFTFDRLGVRVPAVVISPYTERGTVEHTVFDHTSIIRTVRNRWDLTRPLTHRDAHAADLSCLLNRDRPRDDYPEIRPRPYEPSGPAEQEKLNLLQRAILALVAAVEFHDRIERDRHHFRKELIDIVRFAMEEGEIAKLETVGDAIRYMTEKLQPKT